MVRWLAGLWLIIAVAFPLLEIWGIWRLWPVLGGWTLAWLLLAAVAGVALIAAERAAFLPGLVASIEAGGNPFANLKASGLRFLAGLLLILPGAISDVLALLLLLWAGHRPAAPLSRPRRAGRTADDEVIEGDYRRLD